MSNPTGLTRDLLADFEYLTQDIDHVLHKTWLKPAIKSNLRGMNADMPREVIDAMVEFIYLTDHA